jgi:hypothetical protein
MGSRAEAKAMTDEPTPEEEYGGEAFMWNYLSIPGVKTAILGSTVGAAILVTNHYFPAVTDITLRNTQNPEGSGSCESFGGTLQNLGGVILRGGSLVYNNDNLDSRVAASVPETTKYAWEVCKVTDSSGHEMYGVGADVVEPLLGVSLNDNDNQAWFDGSYVDDSAN